MSALRRLKATMKPGVRLRVVEQTYRPELIDSIRTVTRANTTRYHFKDDAGSVGSASAFPTRTSDVTWLDERTVRYKIGRDDHTVTLSILD